ncbi:histone H1.11R-like [Gopherus flavomarginatus]|uniref:histone H1.11R-like n=1 Tax=Gopherus flavomarginatus TaxID=286002 RepID=UPI0021CBF16D|nr:histone H1.11R-like [Gopherus flavomarginatus]
MNFLVGASRAARENPRRKRRRKPTLSQVILRAADVPAAGRGLSLAAIKKMLEGEGYDVRKNKGRIKAVLRSLLRQGALRLVSGSGASGSFRLQRGGGAVKAEKRETAAAKRRQSSAKTGTAAPGPNDPGWEIKAAAARLRVSRSLGKIRGTVATRRKQILEDIIKGAFLLE